MAATSYSQRAADAVWHRLTHDHKFIYAESILTFVIVWSFAAQVLGLEGLISSPSIVGLAIYDLFVSGTWWPHLSATLRHLFVGFGYAMILGTTFGVLMSLNSFADGILRNWIFVVLALPGLFIVIYSAMWWGLGDIVPIATVAITMTPYTAITLKTASDNIDPELFQMSDAFGVSNFQVIRNVMLPAIAGEFFGAARFAISVGWKEVMLAEFIAANNAMGVGAQIADWLIKLSLPGILKWAILVMVVIAFIQFVVFKRLEEYLFTWREDIRVL